MVCTKVTQQAKRSSRGDHEVRDMNVNTYYRIAARDYRAAKPHKQHAWANLKPVSTDELPTNIGTQLPSAAQM
jgi:hypothetical protein